MTQLTLTATPDVVDYGGSATLAGELTVDGAGFAGAALAVSSSTDGAIWSDVTTVTTGPTGDYSLVVAPDAAVGATTFRVAFAGDAVAGPATAEVVVGSRAALDAPDVPVTVGHGSVFVTSGTLAPLHAAGSAAVNIECYRLESGDWVLRSTVPATIADWDDFTSGYRVAVRLRPAGTWRLVATHADAGHAASASQPSARVRVTPGPDRPIWDRDGVTTIPERMKSRLDARQLVVVTGSRLGIRAGRVRFFEYRSGDWVRTMDVSARWGENGLVNGLLRHAGTRTTPTGIWLMPGWAFGTHPRKPSGVELGWRHITQNSWWSSENNATYNTWVETSRFVYGEHLADYPVAYEYGINSGYNARPNPCVYGRGSGIFLHVVHPGYSGGCVTIRRANMIRLLRQLDPDRDPACAIGTTQSGTKTSIFAY